jgi:hypothetical protein
MHQAGTESRIRAAYAGVQVLDPDTPKEYELFVNSPDPQLSLGTVRGLRPVFASVHSSLSRRLFNKDDAWSRLLGRLSKEFPLLSLHSGGGGWKEMCPNIPFYPESLFQTWAFTSPCKLCLSEALYRSRAGGAL